MIDQMATINLTYLAELMKNSDYAAEQYEKVKEFLVENLCTFGDKPVPTFLKPHFIKKHVLIEQWTYNHGPHRFMDHIRLENGRVKKIISGEYGH